MKVEYTKTEVNASYKRWLIIPKALVFMRIRLFVPDHENIWVSFWFIEVFGFVLGGRFPGWAYDKHAMLAPGENHKW